MEVRAKAKYIKLSPRKVRLVVDIVRGMNVAKGIDQLSFINKKAAQPVRKLLNSAVANAENNFELQKDNLYIKDIRVDDGPTLHRWRPRARGRATPIRKRTSHINIVLAELVDSGAKEGKKQAIEAPIKLGEKEAAKKPEDESDKEAKSREKEYPKNRKEETGSAKPADQEKKSIGKMFHRKSG